MAADKDSRIFPDADIDFGNLGMTIGGSIRFIQQGHGVDRGFAGLHDKFHHVIYGQVFCG